MLCLRPLFINDGDDDDDDDVTYFQFRLPRLLFCLSFIHLYHRGNGFILNIYSMVSSNMVDFVSCFTFIDRIILNFKFYDRSFGLWLIFCFALRVCGIITSLSFTAGCTDAT